VQDVAAEIGLTRSLQRVRGWALALVLLAAPAWAQPAPDDAAPALVGDLVFSQTGVPADATAENAVLARDNAFASARRAAWDRMLAAAALPPRSLSPAQLERLVSSIIIEEERVTPTRYSGRLTVNFAANAVRSTLGQAAAGGGGGPGASPGGGIAGAGATPRPGPAVASVDAVAVYASLAEWLELRRRLQGAAPIAGVEILGISVDAARLRLALRLAPAEAAAALEALGVALAVEPNSWRVRLAAGG